MKTREDWMDVASDNSSEESDEIPPEQPVVDPPNPIMDGLMECLSRMQNLRENLRILIRTEYYP